jgi:thiol-disulfide isomerase/thioredoxin
MKKLFYPFISLLIFTGCNKQSNSEITVVGHLNSTDSKEITLTSDYLNFKTPADSNGNFILQFSLNQPRIYLLNNSLNLFLIPGDSLIIDKEVEDYKFSGGQSAVLSNYYQDWEKYWNKVTASFDYKTYYSREPDEFFRTIYEYIDTAKIPLNELSKKVTDINPEFLRLENERLKYWMIIDFLPYEYQMYKYYTGEGPAITESFHDYMKDVNLNDTSLLQLQYYKDFLTTYVYYKSSNDFKNSSVTTKDKFTETDFTLDFIYKVFNEQKILDFVTYSVMHDRTNLLAVNDKSLLSFKEHCSNKDYIEQIYNTYRDLQPLMPGNPAPEFVLYDSKDKEYRLSDYKGKNLLIDVWGVYCGPCIREMPYLEKIEEDYKGKDIEFICACVEKDHDLWLRRMKELNVKGTQLNIKGGRDSQFRKDYKIIWTPTYILIDKEGKFIDARAPKPTEDLRDLLDKIL